MEVVGSQITGWSLQRSTDFSSLQGRLDDSGDADCNLVLELEYVLERAVETVGPEMGAVTGVDQLLGGLC